MTSASDAPGTPARLHRPGWAARNYSLLTAAAVVTSLGANGSLVAAAFAVLDAGGDGGDVGLVAAARTLPLVLFLLIGGAVADRFPRHRGDGRGQLPQLPLPGHLRRPGARG